MGEWLGLTNNQYLELLKKVSIADMVSALEILNSKEVPVSKIALAYYIDNGGDTDSAIFLAIFNTLQPEDKIDVIKYME